jgi:hypothetical protein
VDHGLGSKRRERCRQPIAVVQVNLCELRLLDAGVSMAHDEVVDHEHLMALASQHFAHRGRCTRPRRSPRHA